MQNFRKTKMTVKARKAIETLGQMYNIRPEFFRKDRAAVMTMYADLEGYGYEWVSAKQEWALISAPAMLPIPSIRMSIAVPEEQQADALYILEEGMSAAGFEIMSVARFIHDIDHRMVCVFEIEVKL